MIPLDRIALPFDKQLLAAVTVSLLAALSGGDIAGIDIAQAGLEPDLPGPAQGGHRGGGPVHHLEGGVEGGDVPGNVHAHALDELGDFREFLGGIVVPGDDQGGDFDPDPRLLESDDGVQHRLQPGLADLAVKIVPHTFQIDVVAVDEFRQGHGGGLRHKAVGHEDVFQVLFVGQLAHVLGVFHKNGGLGVGVGDAGRMGGQGIGHDAFRVTLVALDQAAVYPGILGNVVVLAVQAHEIAQKFVA